MRAAPVGSPKTRTSDHRLRSHRNLQALETDVTALAVLARRALDGCVDALTLGDETRCAVVVAGRDELVAQHRRIESGAFTLLSDRHRPAIDARLVVTLTHVAHHLERIGAMAAAVAGTFTAVRGGPRRADIVLQLAWIGEQAAAMSDLAIESFTKRDGALSVRLATIDDDIGRSHDEVVAALVECRHDPALLSWTIGMLQIAHCLRRAAEHAVEIGAEAARRRVEAAASSPDGMVDPGRAGAGHRHTGSE